MKIKQYFNGRWNRHLKWFPTMDSDHFQERSKSKFPICLSVFSFPVVRIHGGEGGCANMEVPKNVSPHAIFLLLLFYLPEINAAEVLSFPLFSLPQFKNGECWRREEEAGGSWEVWIKCRRRQKEFRQSKTWRIYTKHTLTTSFSWNRLHESTQAFPYFRFFTQSVMFSRVGSRSPCANATSHQLMANSSQLLTNVVVKMTSVKRHLRSTSVVKTSCRNLPCSRMFLCAKLHEPFLAIKRALFTRSLNTGLRGIRETSPGRPNSSGMMLFLASIFSSAFRSRWQRKQSSVRLYARTQHAHPQGNAQRRTSSYNSVAFRRCFGLKAARRLCSEPLRAGTVSTLLLTHFQSQDPLGSERCCLQAPLKGNGKGQNHRNSLLWKALESFYLIGFVFVFVFFFYFFGSFLSTKTDVS